MFFFELTRQHNGLQISEAGKHPLILYRTWCILERELEQRSVQRASKCLPVQGRTWQGRRRVLFNRAVVLAERRWRSCFSPAIRVGKNDVTWANMMLDMPGPAVSIAAAVQLGNIDMIAFLFTHTCCRCRSNKTPKTRPRTKNRRPPKDN